MARTIEEIRLEMVSNYVANPIIQTIYGITPGSSFDAEFSKVSFEAIFFHFVSTIVYTVEKLFDQHKAWIETRAAELKGGQLPWYVGKAKEFQYGDTLVYQDEAYKYATINTGNQIVKLAAATELGSQIILKVATLDSSENTVALSTPELAAFTAYMKKIKYAGPKLTCVSRDPDLMIIQYRVYVDALVIASDGSLISNPSVFPVENAINSYIKNLDFNGRFSVTELTDKIQQQTGVNNPVFEAFQAKFGTNPYSSYADYYTPNAGYLTIDIANPLSSTINYILQ